MMDLRGLKSPLEGTLFLFTGNYQSAHPIGTDRLRDATIGLAILAMTTGTALFWTVTGAASRTSAADVVMRFLS